MAICLFDTGIFDTGIFDHCADATASPHGKVIRRWRSRVRRKRLDELPIRDQDDLKKAIRAALDDLGRHPRTRERAAEIRRGLLHGGEVKRRKIERVDTSVVQKLVDDVEWALDAYIRSQEEAAARHRQLTERLRSELGRISLSAREARRIVRKRRDEEALVAVLEELNQRRLI